MMNPDQIRDTFRRLFSESRLRPSKRKRTSIPESDKKAERLLRRPASPRWREDYESWWDSLPMAVKEEIKDAVKPFFNELELHGARRDSVAGPTVSLSSVEMSRWRIL